MDDRRYHSGCVAGCPFHGRSSRRVLRRLGSGAIWDGTRIHRLERALGDEPTRHGARVSARVAAGGWTRKIHIQLAALTPKETIQTTRRRFRFTLGLEMSPPYISTPSSNLP